MTKTSNAQPLEITVTNDIVVCTLTRPERRNALTAKVRSALTHLINDLATDEGTRGLVLASNGSFSAGQDLGEAREFRAPDIERWIGEHMALYDAIMGYPKPLVAAIDGCCVGAGLQMALLCDLRVGGRDAFFAMPEIDDGIPCILGVWTLWDAIGRSRTTEMVLTNRHIYAPEAHAWGILNELASDGSALQRAVSIVEALAAKPRLAMRLTKQRLRAILREGVDALAVHAVYAHATAFESGQPREAMDAFLAKRRRTEVGLNGQADALVAAHG
jgi:enoyl-CoA hydratase/carnithine racemase